jgi:beta/gamma crystallin
MWNSHFGRWSLLIAITALGVSPAAQSRRDGGTGITVYSDSNFRGQGASFRDDMPDLVRSGWNDKISSIRIPSGEAWEVCQDIDYGNPCQVLSGNVADLGRTAWNDRISSLRRIDNGAFRDRRFGGASAPEETGTGVIVYSDIDFRGQGASFRGDMPNLLRSGWNDKISSIRVLNGETWEVCEDIEYGNHCEVLSGSVANLRSMGWNDRISSLRQIENRGFRDDRFHDRRSGDVFEPGAQPGLLFYDRQDYRGTSTLVMGGSSNIGPSARQGSVQLRGGGSWELCDSAGGCTIINQDVADVSRLGLNGRITSARVVTDARFRRDRDDDRQR